MDFPPAPTEMREEVREEVTKLAWEREGEEVTPGGREEVRVEDWDPLLVSYIIMEPA